MVNKTAGNSDLPELADDGSGEPMLELSLIHVERHIKEVFDQYNITDAVIEAMEKEYGDLVIDGLGDYKGYSAVKQARIKIKKFRVTAANICDAARDPYLRVNQRWIKERKDIEERISPLEDRLHAMQKDYEGEREKKAKQEVADEFNRHLKRHGLLIGKGVPFDGERYVLGDVSYDLITLRVCSDSEWDGIWAEFLQEVDRLGHVEIKQGPTFGAAQKSDKMKWFELIHAISEIEVPDMKGPTYRKKIYIFRKMLEEVRNL